MANIKLDFKESKLMSEEILEHSGVVEEINEELIEKAEDETEFLGWINLPTDYDYIADLNPEWFELKYNLI